MKLLYLLSDVPVHIVDMPASIRSFTITDENGTSTIFINALYSRERQAEFYNHEVKHILHDDFYSLIDADMIEYIRHG